MRAADFFGLDVNPLAVEIAKVAMMIARKLAIDELHIRYSAESVFDTFPWPQVASAPEVQGRLAGGTAPGPPSPSDAAPRRGAGTTAGDPQLRRPSGAESTPPASTGGGGRPALPPANLLHPSGMLGANTIAKIRAVAEAGRQVRRVRAEALFKLKGGLRALYRTLELPGANPLKDAHAALDAAVVAAYGFVAPTYSPNSSP